jgi:hypothetical protein
MDDSDTGCVGSPSAEVDQSNAAEVRLVTSAAPDIEWVVSN